MVKKDQIKGDHNTESIGEEKNRDIKEDESGDKSCRCKESTEKTVPQLLKIVIEDLKFWKR